MINVLGALALGAIGWLTLEFLGRPLRTFFDLRRRAREQMLRLEDAKARTPFALLENDDWSRPHQPEREFAESAITALRGLSAELTAFGDSEWLADLVLRRIGFQPALAGRSLNDLTLGRYGARRAALGALKFPIE